MEEERRPRFMYHYRPEGDHRQLPSTPVKRTEGAHFHVSVPPSMDGEVLWTNATAAVTPVASPIKTNATAAVTPVVVTLVKMDVNANIAVTPSVLSQVNVKAATPTPLMSPSPIHNVTIAASPVEASPINMVSVSSTSPKKVHYVVMKGSQHRQVVSSQVPPSQEPAEYMTVMTPGPEEVETPRITTVNNNVNYYVVKLPGMEVGRPHIMAKRQDPPPQRPQVPSRETRQPLPQVYRPQVSVPRIPQVIHPTRGGVAVVNKLAVTPRKDLLPMMPPPRPPVNGPLKNQESSTSSAGNRRENVMSLRAIREIFQIQYLPDGRTKPILVSGSVEKLSPMVYSELQKLSRISKPALFLRVLEKPESPGIHFLYFVANFETLQLGGLTLALTEEYPCEAPVVDFSNLQEDMPQSVRSLLKQRISSLPFSFLLEDIVLLWLQVTLDISLKSLIASKLKKSTKP